MSYTISKSDGSTITITDNTLNTTSTSLQLIGRGYKSYGSALNTNWVKLLENFSNNVPPINPVTGQIWFKKNSNELYVRATSATGVADTWVNIPLSNFGVPDEFVYRQTVLGSPVIGFNHDNQKVGIFTTLPATPGEIGSLAASGFPVGLNRGLNLANMPNAGIYTTSALHFGLGNATPTMSVVSTAASVFGNFNLIEATNPTLLVRSNSETGNSSIVLDTASSSISRILFNTASLNEAGIIFTDKAKTLAISAQIINFGKTVPDLLSVNANENKIITKSSIVSFFSRIAIGNSNTGEDFEIKSSGDINILFNSGTTQDSVIKFAENNIIKWRLGTIGVSGFRIFNETTLEDIFYIDDDNIGIGNNSPEEKLDVTGKIQSQGLIIRNGSEYYSMPTSAGLIGQVLVSNGNGNTLGWITASLGGGGSSEYIQNTSAEVGVYTNILPDTLLFRTNNTNQMVLSTDGFLGIGTTTPNYLLDVKGIASVNGLMLNDGINVLYTLPSSAGVFGQSLISKGVGNNLSWEYPEILSTENMNTLISVSSNTYPDSIIFRTNSIQRMMVSNTGNVGINTTNPEANLHIESFNDQNTKFSRLGFDSVLNVKIETSPSIIVSGDNSNLSLDLDLINDNTVGNNSINLFKNSFGNGSKSLLIYNGNSDTNINTQLSNKDGITFINASGEFTGIGTNNPTYSLDIKGNEINPNVLHVYNGDSSSFIRVNSSLNGNTAGVSYSIDDNDMVITSWNNQSGDYKISVFNGLITNTRLSIRTSGDFNFYNKDGELSFKIKDNSQIVAGSILVSGNGYSYELPTDSGISGNILISNGDGNPASWGIQNNQQDTFSYNSTLITDSSIAGTDLAGTGIQFNTDWVDYKFYDVFFNNLHVSAPSDVEILMRVRVNNALQNGATQYNHIRKTSVATSAVTDSDYVPITYPNGVKSTSNDPRNIVIRIYKEPGSASSTLFRTNNYGITSSGMPEMVEIVGTFKASNLNSGDEVTGIDFRTSGPATVGSKSTWYVVGYKK